MFVIARSKAAALSSVTTDITGVGVSGLFDRSSEPVIGCI